MLAFAFVATLGTQGVATKILSTTGVAPPERSGSPSFWGLVTVYTFFQIPLMFLVMLPADRRAQAGVAGGRRQPRWHRRHVLAARRHPGAHAGRPRRLAAAVRQRLRRLRHGVRPHHPGRRRSCRCRSASTCRATRSPARPTSATPWPRGWCRSCSSTIGLYLLRAPTLGAVVAMTVEAPHPLPPRRSRRAVEAPVTGPGQLAGGEPAGAGRLVDRSSSRCATYFMFPLLDADPRRVPEGRAHGRCSGARRCSRAGRSSRWWRAFRGRGFASDAVAERPARHRCDRRHPGADAADGDVGAPAHPEGAAASSRR